jgi:hypothetical protein
MEHVPAGQRIYLDGPHGAFTLGNPADMHVLIAGGIGITPMISMIRTLADRGDRRPVILLYGSKDLESITFREELEALKARLNLVIVHVLSDPPAGWTGEPGYIGAAVFKRHLPPPDVEVPFRTLQLRLGRSHAPFVRRPAGARHGADRDPDGGPVRSVARGRVDKEQASFAHQILCARRFVLSSRHEQTKHSRRRRRARY